MYDRKRSLIFHGVILFLLGLLTGLVERQFANPRMGLSAHLEGLMNGTFLIAVGAIWNEVRMSLRSTRIAFAGFLYGGYANWVFTVFAASLGTKAMTPLTGAAQPGPGWAEAVITVGFVSVGLAMIGASVVLLLGLRQKRQNGNPSGGVGTPRR
jgi:hydroxylaminobenzene mutase